MKKRQNLFISGACSTLSQFFLTSIGKHEEKIENLFLCDQESDALEALADQLPKAWSLTLIPRKIKDVTPLTGLSAQVLQKVPAIDAFLDFTADPGLSAPLLHHQLKDFQQNYLVNALGPMALIQGLFPALQAGEVGKVIVPFCPFLESETSYNSGYHGARSALKSYLENLKKETEGTNVAIHVPDLPPFQSPLSHHFYPGKKFATAEEAADQVRQIL